MSCGPLLSFEVGTYPIHTSELLEFAYSGLPSGFLSGTKYKYCIASSVRREPSRELAGILMGRQEEDSPQPLVNHHSNDDSQCTLCEKGEEWARAWGSLITQVRHVPFR